MSDLLFERKKAFSRWLGVSALGALFLYIFFSATVPAWFEVAKIRHERNELLNENIALETEIAKYRLEKDNLQNSYFYNERLRRWIFQSSEQPKSK